MSYQTVSVKVGGARPIGTYAGTFDPSIGLPTVGTGRQGSILKGDYWLASGAGTIAGLSPFTVFAAGDIIIALVNNADEAGEFVGNKGTDLNAPAWGSITGTLSSQTDLQTALDAKQALVNTALALTDGAAITLTAIKHTLTTDEATVTFTDSYAGDFLLVEVTLNVTSTVWTFPSNSLCAFNGTASGTTSMTVTGVVGDRVHLSRAKVGSNYSYIAFNFGQ